jgi:glycosyltransferase involved in cell wall biosynthesis
MLPVRTTEISSRPAGAPPPKVSVAMITYNHEKYITQAVESVMMQETDFPYELVIGEDCSTDRTREICVELQRKYPDRIRLLLPEKNIGIQPNFVQTLKGCDGEFIALLEGDDYWTAKEKLQKQVRFLESNPDCSSCCHPVTRFYEDGSQPPYKYHALKQDRFSLEQIIVGHVGQTCSVVFRNHFRGQFPEWFSQMAFGDWSLGILNAEHGLMGYMDEVLAAYRTHPGGIWGNSKRIWQLEQFVFLYQSLDHYLAPKYRPLVRQCLSRRAYQLSVQYYTTARFADARRLAWKSLATCWANPTVPLLKRGKQFLVSTVPALVRLWSALKRRNVSSTQPQRP